MRRGLQIVGNANKHAVFEQITKYLDELGINIVDTDFDRPWGGFFVVDTAHTKEFLTEFFPNHSHDQVAQGLSLTPKILVVEPGKRLSWQYHYRREEIWNIVAGPVGVITSTTDEQGAHLVVDRDEVVSFGNEVRHRLIGLESYGVVAEFWRHIDANNPSDEADIVRVEDDFNRG